MGGSESEPESCPVGLGEEARYLLFPCSLPRWGEELGVLVSLLSTLLLRGLGEVLLPREDTADDEAREE